MSPDKITITLYSLQAANSFDPYILEEINNIAKIKQNMQKQAENAQRTPPEILLCVLLVPDWKNGFSYTHTTYLEVKEKFFHQLQQKLHDTELTDIVLEDFYEIASEVEKEFLQGLTSRNKHSDMMKTHALIDGRNYNHQHLQIDSNTQVHDYAGFYASTFGSVETDEYGIKLVASNYRPSFVCASNKVVFTSPESLFVELLRAKYFAYCTSIVEGRKTTQEKHSFYYNCFEPTLEDLGAIQRLQINQDEDSIQKRHIYPANLSHPIYSLTKHVLIIVNLLWKDALGVDKDASDKLKCFPTVNVGDATCGYASFLIAIRRLTDNLWLQKYFGRSEQYHIDMQSADKSVLYDDEEARHQFTAINNTQTDLELIAKFYQQSLTHVQTLADSEQVQTLIAWLASSFPNNDLGNQICETIFGISVSALQSSPMTAPQQKPQVCIIGSGPAGLAAAEQLSAAGIPYVVIEKTDRVGGLSKSFSIPTAHGDFTFDHTGHFLHLRNPYIRERFQDNPNLTAQPKRSAVYIRGAKSANEMVPAPFQGSVHLFPEHLKTTITQELEELTEEEPAEPTSYAELERRKFGNTLGEISLIYNRKLYGHEVDQLSPQQMSRFSPRLSREQLLAGCHNGVTQASYNDKFLYTSSDSEVHGMQIISRDIFAKLNPSTFKFNSAVVATDVEKHRLTLDSGETIPYTHLINTMPLPSFVNSIINNGDPQTAKLYEQAAKLRAQPVKWVAMGIQKAEFLDNYHWIYVPDADLPFYRIGCFSNIDRETAPSGCSSVWVELNCESELSEEESLAAINQFFLEKGWVNSQEDILFAEFREINPAYVLMDEHYTHATENIHSTFTTHNIYSIGRYGGWEYSSMGDALEQGMKVADIIYNELAKKPLTEEEETEKRQYLAVNQQVRDRLETILGAKFSQAAKDLDDQGIVRLDGIFSPEELLEMQQEFAGWAETKPIDTQLHQQFDGVNQDEAYLSMSIASSLAITHPALFLLALHYWGRNMQLSSYRAIRTEPSDDERLKIRAYRWHNDGHGKMVKVMILLTDVPNDGQRMRFYPRTHQQDPLIRSSLDTLYSEKEVNQLKRSYINCSGPAGTVYVFNPEAIHAGTRNNSVRRDILALTFQAYPNILTVPELHESAATRLTSYERRIFRVGTARKVIGGLFDDAGDNDYVETTMARAEQVKTSLSNYQPMLTRYPDECKPITQSRFGLFIRDRQFYLPGFNLSDTTPVEAMRAFQNDSAKLQKVSYYIRDDLSGALLLPISPPPCTKDRVRDGALGIIREGLLKNSTVLEQLTSRVIFCASSISSSLDFNSNNTIARIGNNLARDIQANIDMLSDPNIQKQLTSYLYLIESMEDCMQRVTTYRERRTVLMFLLGANLEASTILANSVGSEPSESLAKSLHQTAMAYITNLYMDPAAKFQTEELSTPDNAPSFKRVS